MSLTARTKLGSYEVLAPLGAGGMGEVYRASDLKPRRPLGTTAADQHIDYFNPLTT